MVVQLWVSKLRLSTKKSYCRWKKAIVDEKKTIVDEKKYICRWNLEFVDERLKIVDEKNTHDYFFSSTILWLFFIDRIGASDESTPDVTDANEEIV